MCVCLCVNGHCYLTHHRQTWVDCGVYPQGLLQTRMHKTPKLAKACVMGAHWSLCVWAVASRRRRILQCFGASKTFEAHPSPALPPAEQVYLRFEKEEK